MKTIVEKIFELPVDKVKKEVLVLARELNCEVSHETMVFFETLDAIISYGSPEIFLKTAPENLRQISFLEQIS